MRARVRCQSVIFYGEFAVRKSLSSVSVNQTQIGGETPGHLLDVEYDRFAWVRIVNWEQNLSKRKHRHDRVHVFNQTDFRTFMQTTGKGHNEGKSTKDGSSGQPPLPDSRSAPSHPICAAEGARNLQRVGGS